MSFVDMRGTRARKRPRRPVPDQATLAPQPPDCSHWASSRRDCGNEDCAELARSAAQKSARTPWREEVWERLASSVRFVQGSFDDDNAFDQLAAPLGELEGSHGIGGNAAFYLSIPPAMFPVVLKQMQRTGMADSTPDRWRRVVVDRKSAA